MDSPHVHFEILTLHAPLAAPFRQGNDRSYYAEVCLAAADLVDDAQELAADQWLAQMNPCAVAIDGDGSPLNFEALTLFVASEDAQRDGEHETVGTPFLNRHAISPL